MQIIRTPRIAGRLMLTQPTAYRGLTTVVSMLVHSATVSPALTSLLLSRLRKPPSSWPIHL
jgi:hypothetical protein